MERYTGKAEIEKAEKVAFLLEKYSKKWEEGKLITS